MGIQFETGKPCLKYVKTVFFIVELYFGAHRRISGASYSAGVVKRYLSNLSLWNGCTVLEFSVDVSCVNN